MTSKQVDKIDIDTIVDHYLIAALWSSLNNETENHFDEDGFDISDIDDNSLEDAKKAVRAFLLLAPKKTVEKMDLEQIGHDLWLTRNGHGAGFWDRGLGKLGNQLTEISEKFGNRYVFEMDGKIIIE